MIPSIQALWMGGTSGYWIFARDSLLDESRFDDVLDDRTHGTGYDWLCHSRFGDAVCGESWFADI